MTIGIATYGPNAGLAAIEALAAVEKIGSGAIGGFVSFAVMDIDGTIHRAETQTGGTGNLPIDAIREAIQRARIAVLMSSGPNRPSPLSQFTPGMKDIGLVTGHRLPNVRGTRASALNMDVLQAINSGAAVEQAVRTVLDENPVADAGIIAISAAGDLAMGNTDYVERFFDAGSAMLQSAFDPDIRAGVLHNAIHPHRGLALMAAQFAINIMDPPDRADSTVTIAAGTPLVVGPRNEIRLKSHGVEIAIENPLYLTGSWDLGLGPRVPVVEAGTDVAVAVYEPYLRAANGLIQTIDGQSAFEVPVRTMTVDQVSEVAVQV
ncbi:hypothetical protein QO002_005461 [Pararhizobium capsulatum DSM 1112]|uniref:Uncharacterized protein n=1 Tax=Pararhizobium capsulatum DSM 1112 TaxID=1121113 RepID=A0ABU0C0Q4_9HYPH|nr:hypothetical protein [Pararhizobium capsulatum]MDQ0323255.1 hypothetical protein [Pararhizobium capsulatum DSM 1112]